MTIIYLLAYEDGTECSEMSAYKIQAPGNYPEENIQHTEHGESLKSRIVFVSFFYFSWNSYCFILTRIIVNFNSYVVSFYYSLLIY